MVTFSMEPKPSFQGNSIYEVESFQKGATYRQSCYITAIGNHT